MISAHATHPGLVRQNNEDYIRTDDRLGIYLVADGIGGHNAGEVASAVAGDTVFSIVHSNMPHTAVEEYGELMIHAMNAAHWEVYGKARSDPSCAGMGTTLVVAIVRDSRVFIANVGDSRCYLFRRSWSELHDAAPWPAKRCGRLSLLTRDHTVGAAMLASGVPIERIPRKKFHTLTRSVGCGNPPVPDFTEVELAEGDLLLICSDGLTSMVTDAEIEGILARDEASLKSQTEALIDAANASGGKDNISVILVEA